MSFSPKTGFVYIPANIAGFPYAAAKNWQPSELGYQTAQDGALVAMPADKTVRANILGATVGALIAWDPVAQHEAWRVQYQGPWNGGTLATAGNLVFQGNAAGEFSAFSADKGSKLWSVPVQSGVIAAPMTYTIDGEQYVAVLAGWGGVWDVATGVLHNKSGGARNISRLLVYKLGGTAILPAPPPLNQLPLDPPPFRGKPEQVKAGANQYARYCFPCHGDAGVGGAVNPDLRRSAMLNDSNAMKAVVVDGILSHNGMVSFKAALAADDAESIRQYLIKRANEDRALGER
jgi:alcohol dehydrogenase (cytochrome c)/quinohemoprotein ethanol dehydrogenase